MPFSLHWVPTINLVQYRYELSGMYEYTSITDNRELVVGIHTYEINFEFSVARS